MITSNTTLLVQSVNQTRRYHRGYPIDAEVMHVSVSQATEEACAACTLVVQSAAGGSHGLGTRVTLRIGQEDVQHPMIVEHLARLLSLLTPNSVARLNKALDSLEAPVVVQPREVD